MRRESGWRSDSRIVTLNSDDIAWVFAIGVEGATTLYKSICRTLQNVSTHGHQQRKKQEHRQKSGSGYHRDAQPVKNSAVEEILVPHHFFFREPRHNRLRLPFEAMEDEAGLPKVQAATTIDGNDANLPDHETELAF